MVDSIRSSRGRWASSGQEMLLKSRRLWTAGTVGTCMESGDWGIRGMELRSSKRHTGDGIYNRTSADLCSVDLNQGGDNHRVS